MPIRHTLIASLLGLATYSALAQSSLEQFDWSLLRGLWAESADNAYGCRPDNLHFRFQVAPDRKQLRFLLDRQWKIAGENVNEYGAQVVSATERTFVIRYGDDLRNIPPEFREWEVRFIGPGTYRWRAMSSPAGQYNTVIGVKCSQD